MNFADYLESKYLEWQTQHGKRKSVKQFAAYIGVSASSISMWWHGERTPEGENVVKIADKFGMEVYDILGLLRPDPMLFEIQQMWGEMSQEEREDLRVMATKYAKKRGDDEERSQGN